MDNDQTADEPTRASERDASEAEQDGTELDVEGHLALHERSRAVVREAHAAIERARRIRDEHR